MFTSLEEALSLLRKWQEEKQLIQAALIFSKTRCSILGRVERIDSDQIQIDGSSLDEFGNRYGLLLQLADVLSFSFGDARSFSQPDPDVAEQVDRTYDSFLSIDLGPCKCVVFACRPPSVHPA